MKLHMKFADGQNQSIFILLRSVFFWGGMGAESDFLPGIATKTSSSWHLLSVEKGCVDAACLEYLPVPQFLMSSFAKGK